MFMCKKSRKEGKRVVWLNQGLLVRLKGKKEKKVDAGTDLLGRVKYADSLCRDGVKKAKAQLKLNMARIQRKISTGMSDRKQRSEKVHSLMNTAIKLVTTEKERAEVLNNFFASVFNNNLSFHASGVDGQRDGDWGSKFPPL